MTRTDHLIIAQFAGHEPARRVLEALRRDPRYEHLEVVVRVPNKPHQTIPVSLSHARAAMIRGVITGAVSGLIVGAVIGWAGYRMEGLGYGIIIAFAALGLVLGSLGAALTGPMNPHPAIERVEEQAGVTIVVNAHRLIDRPWVEEIMRQHAGMIESPTGARPAHVPHPA
ncbi:MAG: prepilin peptidase [Polyangiaceae bacterium]|nr:prepilin peptidase [Polyangiaceae bacterium]